MSWTAGLIAIDGCSAGGKSEIAKRLSRDLGCPMVSLDDYYLDSGLLDGERRLIDAVRYQDLADALRAGGNGAIFEGVCARAVLGRLVWPASVLHVYSRCQSQAGLPCDLDDLEREVGGTAELPPLRDPHYAVSI